MVKGASLSADHRLLHMKFVIPMSMYTNIVPHPASAEDFQIGTTPGLTPKTTTDPLLIPAFFSPRPRDFRKARAFHPITPPVAEFRSSASPPARRGPNSATRHSTAAAQHQQQQISQRPDQQIRGDIQGGMDPARLFQPPGRRLPSTSREKEAPLGKIRPKTNTDSRLQKKELGGEPTTPESTGA